jgi:hypothetical protein
MRVAVSADPPLCTLIVANCPIAELQLLRQGRPPAGAVDQLAGGHVMNIFRKRFGIMAG